MIDIQIDYCLSLNTFLFTECYVCPIKACITLPEAIDGRGSINVVLLLSSKRYVLFFWRRGFHAGYMVGVERVAYGWQISFRLFSELRKERLLEGRKGV